MQPTGTITFSFFDGAQLTDSLVQAGDGHLYGTTLAGGNNRGALVGYWPVTDHTINGYGTLFRLTLTGELTTLHSFDGSDGSFCDGQLTEEGEDSFLGTTHSSIFRLLVDETTVVPDVAWFRPRFGDEGTAVKIIGRNFTGTTAVTFTGVVDKQAAAGFQVDSNRSITAWAPEGATTGPITVIGPGGTATSRARFIVRR